MNGTAERLNRKQLEKGRVLFLQFKFQKNMWGESVFCATYLLNRVPRVYLKELTPAALFYNSKPNLKFFNNLDRKDITRKRNRRTLNETTAYFLEKNYQKYIHKHTSTLIWNPGFQSCENITKNIWI